MSNEFKFIFENQEIRVIVDECGQTWFVAADLAAILEYDSAHRMLRMLLPYEVRPQVMETNGGPQTMMLISESGMYHCVMSSKKSNARHFQQWVYENVLPSIRKSGAYITPEIRETLRHDPEFVRSIIAENNANDEGVKLQRLYQIVEDRPFYKEYIRRGERINELKQHISDNAPYEALGHALTNINGSYTLDQLAKILNSMGVNTGRNRLCEMLRRDGFLMKQGRENRPTQTAINQGLMYLGMMIVEAKDTTIAVPMITPKGLGYFINLYAGQQVHSLV